MQIKERCNWFKDCCTSVDWEPVSSRPSTWHNEKVIAKVNAVAIRSIEWSTEYWSAKVNAVAIVWCDYPRTCGIHGHQPYFGTFHCDWSLGLEESGGETCAEAADGRAKAT
jgi:hypothetical protein